MKKTLILIICLFATSCNRGSSARDIAFSNMSAQLASQKSKFSQLEMAERCAKMGANFFSHYKSDNYDPNMVWYEPEYHYNRRLNTYLIYIQTFNGYEDGESIWVEQIIDMLSNKPLASRTKIFNEQGNGKWQTIDSTTAYTISDKDRLFSE